MTRHLIHIGYPKAGSNYLRSWFRAHPQIEFADGGVGGFASIFQLVTRAAAFTSPPKWRVTAHEGLSFPRTIPDDPLRADEPSLCEVERRQRRACEILSSLFPTAHILVVTRGFRSMILSSYSQYVRTGGTKTLETLIQEIHERGAWDYDRLLGLYRKAFGGRVIVLPYELLAEDAVAFREELQRRLDLDPFEFEDVRRNVSLGSTELQWYPHMTRWVQRLPLKRFLLPAYRRALFRNRLSAAATLLERIKPRGPIDAALISDALLEPYRGLASSLADDPTFAPYAKDYLF